MEGKAEVVLYHLCIFGWWARQNEPKLFHPRLPQAATTLWHHVLGIRGSILLVLMATLS